MLGSIRAFATLIGLAAAGVLVWIATYLDFESEGEFWAAMGLIAVAGLAMGLSQLAGGWTKWGVPSVSLSFLLFGFLPTLIVTGWILVTTQPEGGVGQGTLEDWSDAIGVLDFVENFGVVSGVVAFVFGLVLAFAFDTRRREAVVEEHAVPEEEVRGERHEPVAAGAGAELPDRNRPDAERLDVHEPERREPQ